MNSEPNHKPVTNPDSDDLQPEYAVDYRKATRNRFATAMQQGGRLIVLDPDVAEVFTSAEAVNTMLRAVIHAMPSAASLIDTTIGSKDTNASESSAS